MFDSKIVWMQVGEVENEPPNTHMLYLAPKKDNALDNSTGHLPHHKIHG